MPRYYVITPEYGTTDPILDDGTGPYEYGCDVVEVEAPNTRVAKVLGVRELRRTKSHWMRDQDGDGHSPFTGLKVEPFLPEDYAPDIVYDSQGNEVLVPREVPPWVSRIEMN